MATDPTIMKLRLAAINKIVSAIPVWPNTKGMAEWEKYSKIGMSEVAGLIRAELSNLPKGYNRGAPSLKSEAKRRFLQWRENQAKGEWKTLSEEEQAKWEAYVTEGIEFGEIRERELARDHSVGGEIEFDQIRQGDHVRTVRVFEGGFIITLEGVAERLDRDNDGREVWRMGRTHAVAPQDGGRLAISQHHILLERGQA